MAKRDYYEILGVARDGERRELKAAFRKLAMKHHPDRNPGDKDCEAQVQGNQRGLRGPEGRRRSAPPTTASATPPSSTAGRRRRRLRRRFRLDVRRHLRRLVRRWAARRGRAAAAASAAPTCATTWRSRSRRRSPARPRRSASRPRSPARPAPAPAPRPAPSRRPARPAAATARSAHSQGFFTLERTCPACQGRGQVIDDPCPTCAGAGPRARASARCRSTSRPGVEDGTRIRLAGEGEAGVRGGPAGDLYIFLSISGARASSSATAPTCIAACRSRW